MLAKLRKTINQREVRQTWQQLTKTNKVNVNETERFVSLIGGFVLFLFGLVRRSVGSVGFVFGGAYLLYRGLTGHCSLYELIGFSTASRTERLQFKAGDRQKYRQNGQQSAPSSSEQESIIDETVQETFPASDPPAWTSSRG